MNEWRTIRPRGGGVVLVWGAVLLIALLIAELLSVVWPVEPIWLRLVLKATLCAALYLAGLRVTRRLVPATSK